MLSRIKINTFNRILLYLVIFFIAISYYPTFYTISSLYSIFRLLSYSVIFLLVWINISFNNILKCRITRSLLVILFFISAEFAIFFLLDLNFEFSDLWQLVIVFLSIAIGLNFKSESEENIRKLLTFYSVVGAAVGLISFNFYRNVIDEFDIYAIEGKNQLGLIVSSASAVSLYLGISSKLSKKRIFFVFLFGLGVSILFFMGARSALLSLVLYAFILLFKLLDTKGRLGLIIAVIIGLVVFSNFLLQRFVGNHDVSDLNSISTGRIERNVMGIMYIKDHIWEGELLQSAGIPWIHNYLILRFVRYGMWSIIVLSFYIYILVNIISKITNNNRKIDISNIGSFLLIVPYFVSLLEPSAPFGPGSNVFMLYIIYGISISRVIIK